MTSILYILDDPGIRLDRVKGASIHVKQILRGFAEIGARARVVAPVSGGADIDAIRQELQGVGVIPIFVTRNSNGW